jgi:hypothetical protein
VVAGDVVVVLFVEALVEFDVGEVDDNDDVLFVWITSEVLLADVDLLLLAIELPEVASDDVLLLPLGFFPPELDDVEVEVELVVGAAAGVVSSGVFDLPTLLVRLAMEPPPEELELCFAVEVAVSSVLAAG